MTMSKLIKLLNEPGKIITMATRVLAEHGKEDSMFHEDRGYYFTTMICSYQDIPNKKINIVCVRDMKKEERMRVFLNTALSEYKGDIKTIAAIISLYHRLIDVNPGPKFSEIIIYWNQDATNIDFSKLKNYSFQDLKKDFEARKQVFHFEGDKCISFEKGLWQNYLLNIYASTINFSDFDGGNNRLGQSNPHLKIPKIIEDLS